MFEVEKIRKDFPMILNNPNMVYFDSGATTYKPYSVINKINEFYCNETSNVHRGEYDTGYKVSKEFDEAREVIANFINANSNEIIFTSGTTYSLNQIAYSANKTLTKDDIVLTTLLEHASSILPWFNTQANIQYLKVDKNGNIDIDYLKEIINEKVKYIVVAHVSNVFGNIQPIKQICNIAHKYDCKVVLDAAQSAPHIKIDVKDLDVDFMAFSGHKMCGPSGIGILYGKYELLEKVEPILYGGGSNSRFVSCGDVLLKEVPYRFESGTPNIEGVLGLKEAILYLESIGMENIHNYEIKLKNYLLSELKKLDNVEIYNPNTNTGIVVFNVKDVFAQDTASYLGNKNICVRSGNHCAKMTYEIINKVDTVRASLYFYNTFEEIDKFIEEVKNINIDSVIDIFF